MGMFDLTGRLAVVTGCRRGIGLAMAEALAGAGADIIGVSRQLDAESSEVQQRVEATGRTFAGHCVDFADRVAVQQFASELGGVDARSTSSSTTPGRSPAQQQSTTPMTPGTPCWR